MGGCCDTENESLNNWEMLSNKGVGTADQWERGTAANHNSTHFLVWSTGPLLIFFGRPDWKFYGNLLPIVPWLQLRNSVKVKVIWNSAYTGIYCLVKLDSTLLLCTV